MHNIWYNTFTGDENSSTYATVDKSRPYGPVVFIRQEEYINHLTKWVVSNLRRLVKEYDGKKLEDGKGISGKKKLTNAKIDAMQKFYGSAIRDNKVDVLKMSGEVRELLGHYSSTIEKHLQSDCLKDSKS